MEYYMRALKFLGVNHTGDETVSGCCAGDEVS